MNDQDAKQAAMRERVKELGRLFLERTAQEVRILNDCLNRIRQGDTAAFRELEQLAHKINGTGASLGFPLVSEAAGRIEELARGANPVDLDKISVALDALRESTG